MTDKSNKATALKKGISITYTPELKPLTESRVWLSAGTAPHQHEKSNDINYCEHAYIPNGDWRTPVQDEFDILFENSSNVSDNGSISIIKLPHSILEPLDKLNLSSIKSIEHYQEYIKTSEYKENYTSALQLISSNLRPFRKNDENLRITGIVAHHPNRTSTTLDTRRKCHPGLHIDNWDNRSLQERHKATNRISINVGQQDRYLIYLNLELQRLYDLAKEGGADLSSVGIGTGLAREFMRLYPSYPVVKLRISPGEAYIAPTENMIHDGCTHGQIYVDLSLIIRGYFNSLPVSS
jgi:hypothetical protein